MKKKGLIERFRAWYRKLPEKKTYLEFVSALLTVPVLLTVILINLGNLKSKDNPTPTPIDQKPQIITVIPATPNQQATAIPTPIAQCKKEVGPIQITSPTEGQVVTQSPVCFSIAYTDNTYCSVVWAYRIDGGPLSDYNNDSVCIYNLSQGNHQFELDVKSVVSSDSTVLVRNFVYQGPMTPVPTQTPVPSPTQPIGK